MKKQRRGFWLFVFSLCPGAGHMYMGLMKMGLSFLLGFMVLIGVVGITNLGVLSVLPLTLYIYSFFHAMNIGGMSAEAFDALEDEYLFGIGAWDFSRFQLHKKNRSIVAAACIVLGICMLWNVGFGIVRDCVGWDNPVIRAVYYFVSDEVPRLVIAIAVIWFGVSLLKGKKIDFTENDGNMYAAKAEKPAVPIEQRAEEHRTDGQNADGKSAEGLKEDVQDTGEKNVQENE